MDFINNILNIGIFKIIACVIVALLLIKAFVPEFGTSVDDSNTKSSKPKTKGEKKENTTNDTGT